LKTPQLYDKGEEEWTTKLHLGCGGIFLVGYKNIDLNGEIATIENTAENRTTIDDYYARLEGTADRLPIRRKTIVDLIADMRFTRYAENSVDKIVCIQALEHLDMSGVELALNHWHTILKPKGVLILSVPEMDGTIELLKHSDTLSFAIRHLGGSRRDSYNYHKTWFNRGDILWLLESHGFAVQFLPNIHLYPSIVVRAIK
jgi:hypothetical protein